MPMLDYAKCGMLCLFFALVFGGTWGCIVAALDIDAGLIVGSMLFFVTFLYLLKKTVFDDIVNEARNNRVASPLVPEREAL